MNLLMCAPLYDDKGIVRYFIGAQVDVTGLVREGLGIESFRQLLQKEKDEQVESERRPEIPKPPNGILPVIPKMKDTHAKLQELSMMFSKDESDVVNRNLRVGDDSTDAGSVRSGVPTSVKDRNQRRRIIGGDELGEGGGLNLNGLNLNGNPATSSLPGAYKHVSFPSLSILEEHLKATSGGIQATSQP